MFGREIWVGIGECLRALSPHVVADTRTSGAVSIFRIYRDTRFSKDMYPIHQWLLARMERV
ncbi:MAG: DUF2461 family protein [Anaerolineae bacterium]|nr:DUF2461 family protein [Anaerolineae bacterium]